MMRALRRFWPALLLLAIAIGFYWKVVLSRQYYWMDATDIAYQVIPWLQFQTTTWQHGSFPLWDPRLWGGQPVAGQVQPGVLNPLNWILFCVPMKDGHITLGTLNWYYVLIHYLAALFTYLCCRDRGISCTASILGACSFAFGGFMATILWPQILMSALWLPLLLLFLLRVDEGRRPMASSALAGMFLGLCFLGGHHNVPTYTAVLAAAYWTYYLLAGNLHPLRARVTAGAVFCASFLPIAAAQILPAVELGKLSVRWAGGLSPSTWGVKVPYSVHDIYSLYPTSVIGFAIPGFSRHTDTFVGLVVLTCAAFGAILYWRSKSTRIVVALAALGLLLALGSDSFLYGLVYQLWPGFDKARFPSMAIVLCHAGLAVLAALGFDACLQHARRVRPFQTMATRSLLGLAVFLYAALLILVALRNEQAREYRVLAITALHALFLAGILAAWLHGKLSNRLAAVLLIALSLNEMHPVATYVFRHREQPGRAIDLLERDRDIAAFLRSRPEPVRVEVDSHEIPYNFGDWYGIDQANGFVSGLLQNVYAFIAARQRAVLSGTNYYVGRGPKYPHQILVYSSSSGLNVYRDAEALNRVRTVHRALAARNAGEAVAATVRQDIDLASTAVVEGAAPALETCAGSDEVRIAEYAANHVTVDARMNCRGLLILGDSWCPGWKAYIDGVPAPIARVCSMVRGVVVEGGVHRVTFRYRPWTVFVGGALAALGFAFCAVVAFTRFGTRIEQWATGRAGL